MSVKRSPIIFSLFSLALALSPAGCGDDSPDPHADPTNPNPNPTGNFVIPTDPSPAKQDKAVMATPNASGVIDMPVKLKTSETGNGSRAIVEIPMGTQMLDASGQPVTEPVKVSVSSYNSNANEGVMAFKSERAKLVKVDKSKAKPGAVDVNEMKDVVGATEIYIATPSNKVVTNLSGGRLGMTFGFCSPSFLVFFTIDCRQQSLEDGLFYSFGSFKVNNQGCISMTISNLWSAPNIPAAIVFGGKRPTGS